MPTTTISLENLHNALSLYKTISDKKYNKQISTLENTVSNIDLRSTIGAELDYGYFTMSTNQTTNITANSPVKIDTTISSKNIKLNTTDYCFKLSRGKKYKLHALFRFSGTTSNPEFQFYNKTESKFFGSKSYAPSVAYNTTTNSGNIVEAFYDGTNSTQDIYVALYLTDNIFTYPTSIDKDYTFVLVEEIGRTLILDPLDTQENHTIEYGNFTLSANQTTDITAGNLVKFDTKLSGNMNVENYKFLLKANKNYLLITNLSGTAYSFDFKVKDITNNKYISTFIGAIGMNTNVALSGLPSNTCFYTPTSNVEIGVEIVTNASGSSISYWSNITIIEMAQPIVSEYTHYNQVNNPLTTTDISQESPVGSIISYIGLKAPEHYMLCDGSIFNIVDYQELANFIKTTYGTYNYFGGDGTSTFAVPNLINRFLKGSKTSGVLQDEGLPNITGRISASHTSTEWSGAFTRTSNTDCWAGSGGGYGGALGTFDASKSNTIYGKSDSVTPLNMSVIYCIKFESTYYAVNQYGGFESKILFDGSANIVGNYKLEDSIENYDYLIIHACTITSGKKTTKVSAIISKNEILYGNGNDIYVGSYINSASVFNILAQFNNSNTLYISYLEYGSGRSGALIYKIIGIKGQLPTLLQGGIA
jgi:hypothetical protein